MRVLMPIPRTDFDPTESAVPWRILSDAGVEVAFATPDAKPGAADHRMVAGTGLGPWKAILRADGRARDHYETMSRSPAFLSPLGWDEIVAGDFDGLLLPGGHAPGMKPYLESEILQAVAADFMSRNRPVGAICHGVVLLSRATVDGRSVLHERRATALLRSQEMTAYAMTAAWLGRYYRTYPQTVEDEVRAAVGPEGRFESGPFGVLRDDPDHLDRGFTVIDGNLVTARWPGDAHRFAGDFLGGLTGESPSGSSVG